MRMHLERARLDVQGFGYAGCTANKTFVHHISNHTATYALKRLGSAIKKLHGTPNPAWCNIQEYGVATGAHKLCTVSLYAKDGSCAFWSLALQQIALLMPH